MATTLTTWRFERRRDNFFCDDVAIFYGKLRLRKTKNDDFWLKLLKKFDDYPSVIEVFTLKTRILLKDQARWKNRQ